MCGHLLTYYLLAPTYPSCFICMCCAAVGVHVGEQTLLVGCSLRSGHSSGVCGTVIPVRHRFAHPSCATMLCWLRRSALCQRACAHVCCDLLRAWGCASAHVCVRVLTYYRLGSCQHACALVQRMAQVLNSCMHAVLCLQPADAGRHCRACPGHTFASTMLCQRACACVL